jgi:hypothetical protein
VGAVFVLLFVIGLADGSVSSFNIALWIGVLAAAAARWNSRVRPRIL